MSSAVNPTRRMPMTLAFLLAATVGAGAFVIGRVSGNGAVPQTAPAPAGREPQTEDAGHGEGGEHAEEGVVRFDAEALKLANIRVEPVSYRALQTRLPVTGTVEPNLSGLVKITPRVAGRIETLRVNVGDTVSAGQTLAMLTSTELASAQAAYRQAGVRVRLAASHLQRQRRLADLGEFGRHKVEEARQREIEAHGEINQSQTELAAANNEVAEARSEKAALEGEVARAQNEVGSAESEITEAQGRVRALQAALEQAQTAVGVAESKFNRMDRLIQDELVSRQDWEQARADLQQARTAVEAARANISEGTAKVETARAHREAAQSQVRAAHSRVQQAADKIETLLARQAQVEARLATARKRDQLAEQALQREERIYKAGFLTSKEVTEAETALRQAEAEQQAAADAIRLLGGRPGGGNTLAVTAPIGGRVTERLVSLGETVEPAKSLFTVVNLRSVWVQLSVPQREVGNLRVGQAVTITSDTAPGRTFTGAVSYIGDVVDTATRTVKVRAVIQNSGNALRPQTFVKARIATEATDTALAVPREAVQRLEGKQVVFVQGDHPGEFVSTEVEVGETVGGQAVISSGLEPGARVVTEGAFVVKAQAMKSELGHEH